MNPKKDLQISKKRTNNKESVVTMDKKIRVGIIGCGARGRLAFGAMLKDREDCEICALHDTNAVRMREVQAFLGGNMYTDLDEMLEKENLDCAVITTPDAEHEACAVKALNHGINILIDKPLAVSAQSCQNVIDAMHKSGKIAMMGFNLRHHPVLKRMKEIIDQGTLGKVILIENREFYDAGRTYMARWNGKKSYSGGLWNHKGSHDFDIFNWYLGFPKPVKVSCFAGMNVFRPENIPFKLEKDIPVGPGCNCCYYAKKGICKDAHPEKDTKMWGEEAIKEDGYRKDSCMYMSDLSVHDNGFAIVEYENGARVCHMECFVCGFSDRIYTIVGDRAIAQVSLHNRTIRITDRWTKEKFTYEVPMTDGGHGGADPLLLDNFIRTVKGEVENLSTLEQGKLSTSIAEAAELSRERGETIKF